MSTDPEFQKLYQAWLSAPSATKCSAAEKVLDRAMVLAGWSRTERRQTLAHAKAEARSEKVALADAIASLKETLQ